MTQPVSPCGCSGDDLCPQHVELLPPPERRVRRCRSGVHNRGCPPTTCPLKAQKEMP
jgi:hypothetical protein